MKSRKIYLLCMVAGLLLSVSMYACEKGPVSEVDNSGDSSLSGSDSRITAHLSAMNMYNFADKIKAPEFELSSVEGGKVNLTRFRGKVVLLSFWATW